MTVPMPKFAEVAFASFPILTIAGVVDRALGSADNTFFSFRPRFMASNCTPVADSVRRLDTSTMLTPFGKAPRGCALSGSVALDTERSELVASPAPLRLATFQRAPEKNHQPPQAPSI